MVVRSPSLAYLPAATRQPLRLLPPVQQQPARPAGSDASDQAGARGFKSRTYYWCKSRHGDGVFPYFRQSDASWWDVYFETEIGNDKDVGENFVIGPEIAGWDVSTSLDTEPAARLGWSPRRHNGARQQAAEA